MKKIMLALIMGVALISTDAFAAMRKACPAGTYSKAGAKSLADCISCTTLGSTYYSSSEASTKCTQCSNGKIANEDATGCLDSCNTKQILLNGKCTACPTGYICNGTANFECSEGYYKGSTKTTKIVKGKKKTVTTNTCVKCGANMKTCTGTEEFTCNDGFFKNGKACTACPKNYKTCTQTGFTCQDGFYENGTACTACPAGYYCSSVEDGPEV